MSQGPDGLFFEVTASGDKVWGYEYSGAVFRVERYSPDYAAFDGTDLAAAENLHPYELGPVSSDLR